jgi:hypothetical protein
MRPGLKAAGLALALLLDNGALAQEQAEAPAPVTRPAPPRRPELPMPSEADCEVPATRDALLADPEAAMQAASRYGLELNAYSDQLMEWRSDQMLRSGRWTRDDKAAFGMRILQDPEFGRELEAGLGLVGEIMEPAMKIGDESVDPIERCRSLIAIQGAFQRITASVEAQWAIIDRLFAVEAARLGVTLE